MRIGRNGTYKDVRAFRSGIERRRGRSIKRKKPKDASRRVLCCNFHLSPFFFFHFTETRPTHIASLFEACFLPCNHRRSPYVAALLTCSHVKTITTVYLFPATIIRAWPTGRTLLSTPSVSDGNASWARWPSCTAIRAVATEQCAQGGCSKRARMDCKL